MGLLNVDWSARRSVSSTSAFTATQYKARIAKAIQRELVGFVLRSWKGGHCSTFEFSVVMSSVSTGQKDVDDVHIDIRLTGFPFTEYRNDLFTGALVELHNLEVEGHVLEQRLNDSSECVFPAVPKGRYAVVLIPIEE